MINEKYINKIMEVNYMTKINLKNSNIAMIMICEAIGEGIDEWDPKDFDSDDDGLYDIAIKFNGKEINAKKFIESLDIIYRDTVKKHAADLLSLEYGKMLDSIYEIQEALNHHNKIFDKKVYD